MSNENTSLAVQIDDETIIAIHGELLPVYGVRGSSGLHLHLISLGHSQQKTPTYHFTRTDISDLFRGYVESLTERIYKSVSEGNNPSRKSLYYNGIRYALNELRDRLLC